MLSLPSFTFHLPSGKRLQKNYGKIQHFQWVNPLEISINGNFTQNILGILQQLALNQSYHIHILHVITATLW